MSDLPLPIDIPWKLIDVSAGMMDTGFCDESRPPVWRPSLALFAYEPDQELIPNRCGQRITFLKVTVSVTGIQPPLIDDDQFDISSQLDFLDDALSFNILFGRKYLACYGVLLNVSVFPDSDDAPLSEYPHIVDFEPKRRELIQSASQDGEVLTASKSQVGTDKSFQRVSGSEFGVSHTGKYTSPESSSGKWEASHTISGKWTNTDTEKTDVTTDASTERRERYSTQTALTQLYNILTGYHLGTNRASFLMLPRPHLVQPTRFRTFVHGIRQIEGVQEFLLVVARPEEHHGMRIELTLDTGHFPENVPVPPPIVHYDQDSINIPVNVTVLNTDAHQHTQEDVLNLIVPVPEGWEIDIARGEAGRGGVRLARTTWPPGMHRTDVQRLDYTIEERRLIISYRIQRGHHSPRDVLTWHFEVFIRRARRSTVEDGALGSGFFVGTRTRLCTGLSVEDDCIVRHQVEPQRDEAPLFVNEFPVAIPDHIASASDPDFARAAPPIALAALRTFLVDTARQSSRGRPTGYAFTRSFGTTLAHEAIGESLLGRRAADIPILKARFSGLGSLTLRQFMTDDATKLANRLQIEPSSLVKSRMDVAVAALKQKTYPGGLSIEDGLRLTLPIDLLFEFDSADLSPQVIPSLAAAARMLGSYPDANLRVIGHTDSVGSDEYNRGLSERRAQAVVEVLVHNYNFENERFSVIGRGAKQPIAHNINPDGTDNPEGRRVNRRVEIEIVTKDVLPG